KMGVTSDNENQDTLFGKIEKIRVMVEGIGGDPNLSTNVEEILALATAIDTHIGVPVGAETMYSRFTDIEGLVGTIVIPDESTNWSTLFGRIGTSAGARTIFETMEDTESTALGIDSTVGTISGNLLTLTNRIGTSSGALTLFESIEDASTDTGAILSRIGTSSTGNTMFETLESAGFDPTLSPNVQNILSIVEQLETYVGTIEDTAAENTVFGDLQEIITYVDTLELLIGTKLTDEEAAELDDTEATTIFGQLSQLAKVRVDAESAKNNAAAAMSEAQSLRTELGAKGASTSTYDRIKALQERIDDLKTATQAISESQVETGTLASEILNTLTAFVRESAAAAGLEGEGLSIQDLSTEQAKDREKVTSKLDEINAKLTAIKESIEINDVVVKTWFEEAN
ncbi:MAG TPA: hypothetical protein P5246_03780, partial [Candidatus Omnitrophota bacterium]|nr:hypothetical protein [Candidatus Omnitrophota bacterium]